MYVCTYVQGFMQCRLASCSPCSWTDPQFLALLPLLSKQWDYFTKLYLYVSFSIIFFTKVSHNCWHILLSFEFTQYLCTLEPALEITQFKQVFHKAFPEGSDPTRASLGEEHEGITMPRTSLTDPVSRSIEPRHKDSSHSFWAPCPLGYLLLFLLTL